MSNKIGRNDPCWCGSGKKFKHCHYNRDKRPAPTPNEFIQEQKKASSKRECLHPQAPKHCQGGIIRAHTVQRNGGLSKIARDGHVYTPLIQSLSSLNEHHEMQLEGIRKASTFSGFCSHHDNELFSPIESHPLEANQRHAFYYQSMIFFVAKYKTWKSFRVRTNMPTVFHFLCWQLRQVELPIIGFIVSIALHIQKLKRSPHTLTARQAPEPSKNYHPRCAILSPSSIVVTLMPTIASPKPRLTLASASALSKCISVL